MKDYNKELEFVQGSIKTKIWYQWGAKLICISTFWGKLIQFYFINIAFPNIFLKYLNFFRSLLVDI